MEASPQASLPRRFRLRIVGVMVAALVLVVLLFVAQDFVGTARRLDVIERERDGWQHPAEILAALDLHQGNVVADLGCGSGYFTLKLAPSVGPNGLVLAVDVRGLPLWFVRFRVWNRGLSNVRALRVSPEDPGLPDDGVDAVLVLNTYHEIEDARTVLAHLRRALRAGGRLVLVDPGPRPADSLASAGKRPGPNGEAEHHLALGEAESGLSAAGFQIFARDDAFIDHEGDRWWMIVARRP